MIFSGTSIAVMNISNEELYEQYGIAAVTLGEPEQSMFLSYYVLMEALNYQTPKVVFLDINSMFYSEVMLKEKINSYEHYYLHYSLDEIKNPLIKYEALQAAKKLNPDIDVLNYYLPIYYNHSNWEDIREYNFTRETGQQVVSGNYISFEIAEGLEGIYNSIELEYDVSEEEIDLPEYNKIYLMKIIELCKEKEVQLVFLRGAGVGTFLSAEKYNAINKIAIDNDIPFIDILQHEEVGFDWRFDAVDANHHNIVGAKKWTDYLGEYLIRNYEFEDKRNDPRCGYFEDEAVRYKDALEVMQTKIDLLSAIDFEQYLDVLKKVDTNKNTIFISVSDDASRSLTEGNCKKFLELGLTYSLLDKFRYSYVAVLDNYSSRELLGRDVLILEGNLDNGSVYQISSGGYFSETSSSIQIDDKELIQGERGFNFVVYNKEYSEILSSVYFDTFGNENPPAARKFYITQRQYEADINEWVAFE